MTVEDTEALRRTVRIYRADNRYGEGAVSALRHLAAEIGRHRPHVALIFKRDFQGRYRGSRLGIFWNFVLPLLPISVYVLLSVLGVFPNGEGLPRSVFVCFNMTLWLLFSGLVEQPIDVLRSRNVESMKTSLPISVSIASSFATLAFETLLRIALVGAVVIFTLTPPQFTAPLGILLIVVGAAFSLSLGLMCAVANVVVPDIRNVVTVLMRYGIFISGVIFPLAAVGPLSWLEVCNPFAILIDASRDLVFEGTLTHPVPLAVCIVSTGVLVVFSARLFYVMEYRIRGVL